MFKIKLNNLMLIKIIENCTKKLVFIRKKMLLNIFNNNLLNDRDLFYRLE